MWKPGTAKPNDAPAKKQSSTSNQLPKDGGATANKKLSGSTMGMRFMQRKNGAKNKEQEERKEVLNATAARKNNRNHTTNNDGGVGNGSANGNSDRKRESEEISKDQSSSDGVIILELASVVDMYGVGSNVVGRRSFGGFHKSVKNTWDAALKRQTDDDVRTKNTKNHITDQELLDRYEKYVKGGRGGEGGGSGKGGSGRKDKRKSRD
mmetsp:Transcript_31807/g.66857  ORF Transcript_31807/g.66857 Transcript_31807/m.66857 type:complete len:208 (+) Transcript_31807:102-725(+)